MWSPPKYNEAHQKLAGVYSDLNEASVDDPEHMYLHHKKMQDEWHKYIWMYEYVI